MTNQVNIDTAAATEVIEYVPLTDLYLSDLNPRQDVAEEGIDLLADSLVACGLIQNLAGLRDEAGKVGVVAGGRRLRALNIAVAARPDLAQVPVRMAPSDLIAEEWANAENTAREELDPVDEVRAYHRMAEKALSTAKISQAFGVTEAHVRRRLALAGLPDPVLDALKTGEISMGQAKAMTVSEDEKKILEVLERAKRGWFNEYQIKSALKPDAVDGDNRKAKFVGREAYEVSGGSITLDLFEDEVLFNNPDILDRLFAEKLEDEATRLQEAEGWAWVMTTEDSNPFWYELQRDHGFARTYRIEGVLSDEQTERYDELADLANGPLSVNAGHSPAGAMDVLDEDGQRELDALQEIIKGEYSDAQKSLSGILVHVSHNGSVEIMRGLVRQDDQAEAAAQGIIEDSRHSDAGKALKEKPAFSQKFVEDMTAIRLAAVQTALLEKPDYLLSLFAFAVSPASGYGNDLFGFGYNATERNTPEIDDQFVLDPRLGGERDEDAETAFEALQIMAGQGKAGGFAAFRDAGKKLCNGEITAFLARAFKMQDPEFMAEIEAEIGADIRMIWTPSAENCFKRLKGPQLDALYLAMLDLSADSAACKSLAKSKKGEKNEALHKLFNDPEHQTALGVTAEQKARIDAWVPECF
ncbi:ParB/RepB/Spo0J family partition protein [uncultured Roseobacter sp.]|uniref:ParB/RepB/Spo0J family partition protein n=1 Tax=uncultured Roseobacter sp. TaxID=114847 RepID=UPI00260975DA|nr:ParB/RepB/Spo0J family partition protein [uncultured Roseobacter sp.]